MRVVACGDALFSSGNLAKRLEPSILATLAAGEATFANAEFICPAPGTPPMPRKYITAVPPRALDELQSLRVNLLSFANNHTADFGPQGVVDTILACEARGLLYSGMGRSLFEARAARFLDTPKGRIAIISAGTTRADTMLASAPGHGLAARPGLNPLRFGRAYVLPDREYAQLQAIDELLGTAAARREVAAVEVAPPMPEGRFAFGSFFEGSLQIERGDKAGVRYFVNEKDAAAILDNIRDAANRADCVLFSLHCHEGTEENWYSPRAAAFIEDFAHRAIEAGAHAFLGHGPHMLRGIAFHRGRPIFYSLGSLLMEFESGEQCMSPEMYEGYGFNQASLPSHLHRSRVADETGRKIGFYADHRFSRSVIATCDVEADGIRVSLLPIDLDLNRDRPHERGVPYPASPAVAREIAAEMQAMSAGYGTRITLDEATGTMTAAPG